MVFLPVLLLAAVLDRLTKAWAVGAFGDRSVELVPGWFSLELHRNVGIAFSLPLEGLLLKLVTVVFIAAILAYYLLRERTKPSVLLHAGYGMLLGGALANAYDRIALGSVVDFLALRYFAVFNVADVFISLGALCILIVLSHEPATRPRT